MKNKKGFTLVEVLAVVVILGILTAIVVPNIFSSLTKAKTKSYNILIDTIKDNAKLYVSRHQEIVDAAILSDGHYTLTLNDLYQDKLLKVPVTDPRTNEEIPLTKTILITQESSKSFIACYEDEVCVAP